MSEENKNLNTISEDTANADSNAVAETAGTAIPAELVSSSETPSFWLRLLIVDLFDINQYHNTLHLHCQEISGDCKRKSPPETSGFFVKPAHVSKILILGKFHSFQMFCIVFSSIFLFFYPNCLTIVKRSDTIKTYAYHVLITNFMKEDFTCNIANGQPSSQVYSPSPVWHRFP